MILHIKNKVIAANIHTIITRLRKYENIAEINMEYGGMPTINSQGYKTPGCFIGWYLYDIEYYRDNTIVGIGIFSKGLDIFKQEVFDLKKGYERSAIYGFEDFIACSNLWNNKHGEAAFISNRAYTSKKSRPATLPRILNCWETFANKLSKSKNVYIVKI